jgi:hypothetical protein
MALLAKLETTPTRKIQTTGHAKNNRGKIPRGFSARCNSGWIRRTGRIGARSHTGKHGQRIARNQVAHSPNITMTAARRYTLAKRPSGWDFHSADAARNGGRVVCGGVIPGVVSEPA